MNQTHEIILAQVGRMTVLGISGGRVECPDERTVRLPVSNGYRVEIEHLPVPDIYEVRRVFERAGKRTVKGTVQCFCDDVSQQAWEAHAFRSYDFPKVEQG